METPPVMMPVPAPLATFWPVATPAAPMPTPAMVASSRAAVVLAIACFMAATSLWAIWPVSCARTPISSFGVSDWMMVPTLTNSRCSVVTKALKVWLLMSRIFGICSPAAWTIGRR